MGFSDPEIQDLKKEAEAKMHELAILFSEHGIERKWKLQDMIFEIDPTSKNISKITPTDWERTKIRSVT